MIDLPKLRDRLNSNHCIYALRNCGQIIYVGRTGNLSQRIARHRSNGRIPFFDSVSWPCLAGEIAEREVEMIDKFQPKLNWRRG